MKNKEEAQQNDYSDSKEKNSCNAMALTKSETKELRRLLKEAVFARDKYTCRKCGKKETLAPAHIYPKGAYRNIEFDVQNIICLCYACHLHWAHKNPIEFTEWIKEQMGTEFEKLKLRANTPKAMPRHYNTLKIYLETEIKKYANQIL